MNLSSRESAPKKMHSCLTMADKLGVDGKVKDMELGDTFSKNYKEGAFHTLRCKYWTASFLSARRIFGRNLHSMDALSQGVFTMYSQAQSWQLGIVE